MLIDPLPGRFERGVVGCEVPVNKEGGIGCDVNGLTMGDGGGGGGPCGHGPFTQCPPPPPPFDF